jgi:uncharacterized protein (TIGR02246 family)
MPWVRVNAVAWVLVVMAGTAAAQSNDEAAIRDVVRQYSDARNRGDEKALAALFVEGADQLVSSGEWRRGRDAVVKGSIASTAGGQRTFTVETLRMVSADVAIVDSRYDIGADTATARRMWAAWILVKWPEGWRIAAIRNMLPAPPVR